MYLRADMYIYKCTNTYTHAHVHKYVIIKEEAETKGLGPRAV